MVTDTDSPGQIDAAHATMSKDSEITIERLDGGSRLRIARRLELAGASSGELFAKLGIWARTGRTPS